MRWLVAVPVSLAVAVAPGTLAWGSSSDVRLVKSMVTSAFYRQDSYTQSVVCRKWRNNPSGKTFVKIALIASRVYGISNREAAKGTVRAMNALCW